MNTPLTARQIVLAARPKGKPKPSDFRLEEFQLEAPGDGQVSLQVDFLSLDPYMRGRMSDEKSYAAPTPVGSVMEGESVATVIESKSPKYQAGDIVTARTGWSTHAVVDEARLRRIDPQASPITTALGVLGMPGLTAYAGLLNIGQPKPGETVVVAAASGPVGSLVGQIAKVMGARAVGIAGGSEKCAFVKNDLGFDIAIDHKAADFSAQLVAACPRGIDVYFELVGGPIWRAVLPLLNKFARIPVCGLTAQYNGVGPGDGTDYLPGTMRRILSDSMIVRGFIYYEFEGQRADFLRDVSGWITDGKVSFREDIIGGLENAPGAFIGMLEGQNFGKLLVRVSG